MNLMTSLSEKLKYDAYPQGSMSKCELLLL